MHPQMKGMLVMVALCTNLAQGRAQLFGG